MSTYVIQQEFQSDGTTSAVSQALAWVTIQGKAIVLDTLVGTVDTVSVFYTVPQTPEVGVYGPGNPVVSTDTGAINLMDRKAS